MHENPIFRIRSTHYKYCCFTYTYGKKEWEDRKSNALKEKGLVGLGKKWPGVEAVTHTLTRGGREADACSWSKGLASIFALSDTGRRRLVASFVCLLLWHYACKEVAITMRVLHWEKIVNHWKISKSQFCLSIFIYIFEIIIGCLVVFSYTIF